ncbi:MAG: shikimate dehydrogenase [Acidobacteriota bacterium]
MISAKTKVCAVIGDPVAHSLSPQLHNAAFRAEGMDMVYVAFRVRRQDLAAAVHGVRAFGIRGLSVTIPHKVDIIPLLDHVEPAAAFVGSVNTVVNENGELTGHSTDGPGALRALRAAGVDPAGKAILLLGSGGAARAIAFALAGLEPPPRIRILGIVPEELRSLENDLRERTAASVASATLEPSRLVAAVEEAQIIVHATPVGMTPRTAESLVPPELLSSRHVVFDAVYTPLETQLLKDARAAGAKVVPGLGMFVHQAAIQFELWTGTPAPVEVMERTVREILEESSQ